MDLLTNAANDSANTSRKGTQMRRVQFETNEENPMRNSSQKHRPTGTWQGEEDMVNGNQHRRETFNMERSNELNDTQIFKGGNLQPNETPRSVISRNASQHSATQMYKPIIPSGRRTGSDFPDQRMDEQYRPNEMQERLLPNGPKDRGNDMSRSRSREYPKQYYQAPDRLPSNVPSNYPSSNRGGKSPNQYMNPGPSMGHGG